MDFLWLDDFLQTRNHQLSRKLFDIIISAYPLMKIEKIAEMDNKSFLYLSIAEADWSASVIVMED